MAPLPVQLPVLPIRTGNATGAVHFISDMDVYDAFFKARHHHVLQQCTRAATPDRAVFTQVQYWNFANRPILDMRLHNSQAVYLLILAVDIDERGEASFVFPIKQCHAYRFEDYGLNDQETDYPEGFPEANQDWFWTLSDLAFNQDGHDLCEISDNLDTVWKQQSGKHPHDDIRPFEDGWDGSFRPYTRPAHGHVIPVSRPLYAYLALGMNPIDHARAFVAPTITVPARDPPVGSPEHEWWDYLWYELRWDFWDKSRHGLLGERLRDGPQGVRYFPWDSDLHTAPPVSSFYIFGRFSAND